MSEERVSKVGVPEIKTESALEERLSIFDAFVDHGRAIVNHANHIQRQQKEIEELKNLLREYLQQGEQHV
ncbi:hypothetical protein LCGC14_2509280 [marine sediment metagenome]|uniref:Uncharacterized protein n=1 Tax=marine sediment metagenome TaxID=412755 RepID=A0A0F9B0A6_9ZZZZ